MNRITTLRNFFFMLLLMNLSCAYTQTIINGFFPQKNEFTIASSYSYKSYDNFFRGNTLTESTPMDMGEISSSVVSVYGEYGISDWLSTIATLPYITTQNETGGKIRSSGPCRAAPSSRAQVSGIQRRQFRPDLRARAFRSAPL